MAEFWNCDTNGHQLRRGHLSQLYLELKSDPIEDQAAAAVGRLWDLGGNRPAVWCPACGFFELRLRQGPSIRPRRRVR